MTSDRSNFAGLYITEVDSKTFMPISKNNSEYILLSSRPSTLPIGLNWGGENGNEGVSSTFLFSPRSFDL